MHPTPQIYNSQGYCFKFCGLKREISYAFTSNTQSTPNVPLWKPVSNIIEIDLNEIMARRSRQGVLRFATITKIPLQAFNYCGQRIFRRPFANLFFLRSSLGICGYFDDFDWHFIKIGRWNAKEMEIVLGVHVHMYVDHEITKFRYLQTPVGLLLVNYSNRVLFDCGLLSAIPRYAAFGSILF